MSYPIGSVITNKCETLGVRRSHSTPNYNRIFSSVSWQTYLHLYLDVWNPVPDVRRPNHGRWNMCPDDLILDFKIEGDEGEQRVSDKIVIINQRYLLVSTYNDEYPTDDEMFKALAYIAHFQSLETDHKLKILNGEIDLKPIMEDMLAKQIDALVQQNFKQRMERKLAEINEQIQDKLNQIDRLYANRIEAQHQVQGTSNFLLDIKAIQKLQDIDRVEIDGAAIDIFTKPLNVIYYDEAVYNRYRSSYYSDHSSLLEIMDHIMDGRGNIHSGAFRIRITLGRGKLETSWTNLGDCAHPHQSCRGQFEAPMHKAANEYELYNLVQMHLQWFQSLNFDDSVVAQDWLRRYSGVKVNDEVFRLANARERSKALTRLNKLEKENKEETTDEPNDIA